MLILCKHLWHQAIDLRKHVKGKAEASMPEGPEELIAPAATPLDGRSPTARSAAYDGKELLSD